MFSSRLFFNKFKAEDERSINALINRKQNNISAHFRDKKFKMMM